MSGIIVTMFSLAMASPAMVRLLFQTCGLQLVVLIGSSSLYTIAASSLLPDAHHMLWLVMRLGVVLGAATIKAPKGIRVRGRVPKSGVSKSLGISFQNLTT